MEGHPLLYGLIIFLITVINAIISAAEAGLQNINESNVRKKAEEGDNKAQKLLKFFDKPDRYINVTETLFVAINVTTGILYAHSFYESIYKMIAASNIGNKVGMAAFLVAAITIVLLLVIITLGTLFPKRLARRYSEKAAYNLYGFLRFLSIIFFPVCWLLEKCTNGILRLLSINPNENPDNVTEEEIISIVNEGHEQGVLEADEAEMISNIIEFDEKEAKDIMTHRKKIVAISYDTTIKDALYFMLNEKHSRFPVYKDDIDNIVGVLHLKDVMKYHINNGRKIATVMKIVRQPYFVPDTQNIDVLFKEMQRKKIHIAIAIDEYGQTAGIVAMEDILEEIVGDIQDEYDNEEEKIIAVDDDTFMVKGDADLEELCEIKGLVIEDEELDNYDTLNGLLISLLDRIPADGETPTLDYAGYRFEVTDTKSKMIISVKVSKLPEENEEEDNKEEDNGDIEN